MCIECGKDDTEGPCPRCTQYTLARDPQFGFLWCNNCSWRE